MTKWVYQFGDGPCHGAPTGGTCSAAKGAGLGRMEQSLFAGATRLSDHRKVCSYFYSHDRPIRRVEGRCP